MKFTYSIVPVALVSAQNVNQAGNKCWACDVQRNNPLLITNEDMWNECVRTGQEKLCRGPSSGPNTQACFTKERMNGRGQITMIQMGCKQLQACVNNKR